MDISLRVTKDFERCLEDLKKKYGEDFEYINGLHPSQLDFSEFLDNFVKQDTMADATIDPNANAKHKDIRSFMTEKGKSEDKLFGLNKIFLEMDIYEKEIKEGIIKYYEMGALLQKIRDEKLYELRGCKTFSEYCKKVFNTGILLFFISINPLSSPDIVHIPR